MAKKIYTVMEMVKYLPDAPGVYIMKDSKGTVLYVGKAKNLKKRIKNYYGKNRDKRNSVLLFVPKIRSIEHIVTDNEKEAFLLENNLIKKLKPRYNISLKDDKDFLCIRADLREDYPKLTFVRRPKRDGALYFGPYASGYSMKEVMRTAGKIFPLRRCSDHVFRNRSRPCILHQIHLCTAPCTGLITKEAYHEIVRTAVNFLKGNTKDIVLCFKNEMNRASLEERYEDAAKYRDKIRAIDEAMLEQKIISQNFKNMDIWGFARNEANVAVSLLTMRGGKIQGGKNFRLKTKYLSDGEAFTSFLGQYYLNRAANVPPEILIPGLVSQRGLMEEAIAAKAERAKIRVPRRGGALKLVNMAERNARASLADVMSEDAKLVRLLSLAAIKLKLKRRPLRIEGYDISNIQGKDSVGSMAVFSNGVPDKNAYRRFKIRLGYTPDDYSMLNEVLTRRLSNEALGPLPDLMIVDGGKGQLNIAAQVLAEKSFKEIDVISVAKERRKGQEKIYDRIFVPGRKNPLSIGADSPVLHLVMRVRDEAHRFALSYHRKLRGADFKGRLYQN